MQLIDYQLIAFLISGGGRTRTLCFLMIYSFLYTIIKH